MANGDNLILGTGNQATSQTVLNRTDGSGVTPGDYALNVQNDGNAIGGVSQLGFGVQGISVDQPGVAGGSTGSIGVYAYSNSDTAVSGASLQGPGVEGYSYGPYGVGSAGVTGVAESSFGVRGQNGFAVLLPPVGGGPEFQQCGVQGSSNGTGVRGDGATKVGVHGRSYTGDGVYGECLQQPKGAQTTGNAIHGQVPGPSNNGSTGPFAGLFQGDVKITGRLYVGNALVAHPLAMQASHIVAAAVVDLDGNGEAVVELPGGLADLLTNFTYQLTAIGGPAPNLHVAQEIRGDSFKIGGGTGNLRVSWQVGAEAKDAPALREPASEQPYDEELAQEHERWTEDFGRRTEERKDRTQRLLSRIRS